MTQEQWNEMLEGMHSGETHQITEEVFDYYLGVLPPVFMNKKFTFKDGKTVNASFGFAEGYEPITVFWSEGGALYCRRSTMINRLG